MDLLVFFLTVVLVLDCLFLMLLILIQLPKKDAGAGVAFGAGAADALFGAGSGTALTKATKYTAALFLALSLVLSILSAHKTSSGTRGLDDALNAGSAPPPSMLPGALATNPATGSAAAPTNTLMSTGAAAPASPPAPAPANPTPANPAPQP